MSNLVVAAVADTTVNTRPTRLPKHGSLAVSASATTPEPVPPLLRKTRRLRLT